MIDAFDVSSISEEKKSFFFNCLSFNRQLSSVNRRQLLLLFTNLMMQNFGFAHISCHYAHSTEIPFSLALTHQIEYPKSHIFSFFFFSFRTFYISRLLLPQSVNHPGDI